VGAAEGRDRGEPAPLGDGLADAYPLVGAGDVVGVLARGEQLAEDLLDDLEVVHVIAGYRGQRLVEEQHAFLGPIAVHQAGTQVGEGDELQVGVAHAAGRAECLAEALLLGGPVGFEHADVERHPSRLAGIAGLGEQCLRPGPPAVRDRPVAHDRAVHVRQGAGHPNGADLVAGIAMGGIGPLPALDRLLEVDLQVGHAGQALDRRTRRGLAQRTLERLTGNGRVPHPKRSPAFFDQVHDRLGHRPIISSVDNGHHRRSAGAGRSTTAARTPAGPAAAGLAIPSSLQLDGPIGANPLQRPPEQSTCICWL
jgi:hypothetical protein